MRTLQQIKDDILAVQKELVVFEGKRAMLRKMHLELVSFCWYDGMEIDHDSVPVTCPDLDGIDNGIKAAIVALDLYSRTITAMERLCNMISDDYGKRFADTEDEFAFFAKNENDPEEKNREVIKGFQKIRNFFPSAGEECALWEGFYANDKETLYDLLAKADVAIAQGKGRELRRILTDVFRQQATMLKRQVEEHLRTLKVERDQLAIELPNISTWDVAAKCGKPYWVEVSGSEKLFLEYNAFPIPGFYAHGFVKHPIDSFEDDMFHYKRFYDGDDELSTMRIFGFSSKEEFEGVVKHWEVSNEQTDEKTWAEWIISEIDDDVYYSVPNELLPQWKEVLDKAVSILEKENNESWLVRMWEGLLKLPVLELRKV